MRSARAIGLFTVLFLVATNAFVRTVPADDIAERAHKLHFSSIVLDTHADTTQRLLDGKFDIGTRHPDGHIDIPRMREGGLNAQFFSIWMLGTHHRPASRAEIPRPNRCRADHGARRTART